MSTVANTNRPFRTPRRQTAQLQRAKEAERAVMRQAQEHAQATSTPAAAPAAVPATAHADPATVRARRTAHVAADQRAKQRVATEQADKPTAQVPLSPREPAAPDADAVAPSADEGPGGLPLTHGEALKNELEAVKDVKDPGATALAERLSKTPGYQGMEEEDRAYLGELINAKGDEGTLVRKRLAQALDKPGFNKASPEEQTQALYDASEVDLPPSAAQVREGLQDDDAFKALDKDGQAAINKALRGPAGEQFAASLASEVKALGDPEKTPAQRAGTLQAIAARAELAARKDLPSEVKAWADGSLGHAGQRFGNLGSYAISFREMLRSPSFNKLDEEGKTQAIGEATRFFEEVDPKQVPSVNQTRKALQADPAFKAMDPAARQQLEKLIDGDTDVSKAARARIAMMQGNPLYLHQGERNKARMLANVQNLGGVPHGVDSQLPSPKANGTAHEAGTKRLDVGDAEVAPGPATEHKLTIKRGDKSFNIDVVMPDKLADGVKAPNFDQINNALTRLPDDQLRKITKLVVAEDVSKAGASMSTDGSGQVNIYPTSDPRSAKEEHDPGTMAEILQHEVGHIASLQPWGQDMQSPGWKSWKAAMASDGLRPSSYAGTNPAEDFAEAYAAYTGALNDPKAHAAYRKLFGNRFKILDDLLRPKSRS